MTTLDETTLFENYQNDIRVNANTMYSIYCDRGS